MIWRALSTGLQNRVSVPPDSNNHSWNATFPQAPVTRSLFPRWNYELSMMRVPTLASRARATEASPAPDSRLAPWSEGCRPAGIPCRLAGVFVVDVAIAGCSLTHHSAGVGSQTRGVDVSLAAAPKPVRLQGGASPTFGQDCRPGRGPSTARWRPGCRTPKVKFLHGDLLGGAEPPPAEC